MMPRLRGERSHMLRRRHVAAREVPASGEENMLSFDVAGKELMIWRRRLSGVASTAAQPA